MPPKLRSSLTLRGVIVILGPGKLDNACHEKMTINNARIIVIMHQSFVSTFPPTWKGEG